MTKMRIYTDPGNAEALSVILTCYQYSVDLDVAIVSRGDCFVKAKLNNIIPSVVKETGEIFPSVKEACRFLTSGATDHESVKKWIVLNDSLKLLICQLIESPSNCDTHSKVVNLLKPVDDHLQQNQQLVEPQTGSSIADVFIWSTLAPVLLNPALIPTLQKDLVNVTTWFRRLEDLPLFRLAVQKFLTGHTTQELMTASVKARSASGSCTTSRTPSSVADSEDSTNRAPVSPEELAAAIEALALNDFEVCTPKATPILPMKGKRNVLITSALPYVNNVPHLGNIIGCVLSADVYARYCRLRDYNTLYICGTDEYGTATETKAMEEKMTPQQICDKYNKLHTEIYDWFNIDFDKFGRTTTELQTKIAQDIFWKLNQNGFVLKGSMEQLRCETCERYLADRFVEGSCPFCAYEDARGDQCDKCGKLVNAVDLGNPRCKVCKSTPSIKVSEHLFMDLPKLEPLLQEHLDREFERGVWTNNAKVITNAWIRDGLKPRCISRDLKWGTKVPLEGYTDKVFYVWYDAPIGYISITASYTDQWEKWWKNPDDVQLYQFMAKDNVPFHSVIFPCELLGTKEKWTVVNHLSATEYLNYEDGKFSKSRGVGVFGNNAQNTGIAADIWRFYLLFIRPETQDSAFDWDDFMTKNNSELLNNLGNFINRALKFVSSNFSGRIPDMSFTGEDYELAALVTRELVAFLDNLEKIKLREGIRNILSISKLGNQYMQANKPWVLVKGSPEEQLRAGTVVGLAANLACLLSIMIQPYMPKTSATVQDQLRAPASCNILTPKFVCYLKAGHQIGTPSPLFQKIEETTARELAKKFKGQQVKEEAAATAAPTPKASPEEIARIQGEVAKQGEIVKEMKAAGASKDDVQKEVGKLLKLKEELEKAEGGPKPKEKKKAGKPGKQDKKPANQQKAPKEKAVPTASPEEIERLGKEVQKQGLIVRELKAAKADKGRVDEGIAKLKELKRLHSVAQGLDPDAGVTSKKKKEKPAQ